MSEIHVSCNDQVLKVTTAPIIASGGMNEVKVVFTFCEKWDGFVKTAIFYVDADKPYGAILDENDTCILPWEVYKENGTFYFTVFGEKDNTRRTASVVKYKVGKGVIVDETFPSDPTPDVYDQIIAMLAENKQMTQDFIAEAGASIEAANKATENANAVVQDLEEKRDSGYFNGEKGDPGDKDAVLYTEQTLTEEQKASARQNIGAASNDSTLKKDEEASVSSIKILHSPESSDAIFAEGSIVRNEDSLEVNALTLRGDWEGGIDLDSVIIRNVHAGEQPTDAVNLGQLTEMVGRKKVYELISSVTLEEGDPKGRVTFMEDSNGNPFELTDFIIQANAGFVDGSQSTLYMNVNGGGVIVNGAIPSIGTTLRGFNIYFRQEADGFKRVEYTASMIGTNIYNAQSAIANSRLSPPMVTFVDPAITKIEIFTSTGTTKEWVVGSTFTLYGVRK